MTQNRRYLAWNLIILLLAIIVPSRDAANTLGPLTLGPGGLLSKVTEEEKHPVWLAEETIRKYLSSTNERKREAEFYIHGFRWHTMSLKRDAERLHKLTLRLQSTLDCKDDDQVSRLKEAVAYVIGFNMKGLQRIEKKLFFPFVRQKLQEEIRENDVVEAFYVVLDELERCQQKVAAHGENLEKITEVNFLRRSLSDREKIVNSAVRDSSAIVKTVETMLERENALVIPFIARIVPASEQKSFNNKVIRNLGVLDSRLYLVGMHEVISELNDEKEYKLWNKNIPSVARQLVPRWKRILYDPKTASLET